MDVMPEIMDGKNIADFIDPDIAEKLEALEREEEKLQAEGFYDNDEEMVISPFVPSPQTTFSSFPVFFSSTLMTNVKQPKPKSLFPIKSKHSLRKNPKRIKLGYHAQPVFERSLNSPMHSLKPGWTPVESKSVPSSWLSSKVPSVSVREMMTMTMKWTWMVKVKVVKMTRLGKTLTRWMLMMRKDLQARKSRQILVLLLRNGHRDPIVLWLDFEITSYVDVHFILILILPPDYSNYLIHSKLIVPRNFAISANDPVICSQKLVRVIALLKSKWSVG